MALNRRSNLLHRIFVLRFFINNRGDYDTNKYNNNDYYHHHFIDTNNTNNDKRHYINNNDDR